MKRTPLLLLVTATALSLVVAPAARAISLGDLLAGGSISSGDLIFENFRDFSSTPSGPNASALEAAQIEVSPVTLAGERGLRFADNPDDRQMRVGPMSELTASFTYDVRSTGLDMTAATAQWGDFQASVIIGPDGGPSRVALIEQVRDGALLGDPDLFIATPPPDARNIEIAMFAPQTMLTIDTSLSLSTAADDPLGEAQLNRFDQTYRQPGSTVPVPEPVTASLGLLIACALTTRGRRPRA